VEKTTGKLLAQEEGKALITVKDTRSPGAPAVVQRESGAAPLAGQAAAGLGEGGSLRGGLVAGAEPLDSTTVSTFHLVAGREYAVVVRAYHNSYMAAPIIVSEVCPPPMTLRRHFAPSSSLLSIH